MPATRAHPRRGPGRPGGRWRRPATQVAGLIGARPREVVFTGGATEAIAAACWGAAARGGASRWSRRSSTRPCAWPPSATARSRGCRSTAGAGGRRGRAGRGAARHRTGARPVGQSRGGHRAAGRRGGGRLPRAGCAGARRRRPGRGTCRRRLPGAGHRPDVDQRPQVRRADRRRRPAGPPGAPVAAPAGRRRPGAARRAGLENVPAIAGLGALCGALADGTVAADGPSNAG